MGKYNIELILASNGAEVFSVTSNDYTHTEFDEIRADWSMNFRDYVYPEKNTRRNFRLWNTLKELLMRRAGKLSFTG